MSVFACSDLHGHLKLYEAIKNFLKPEDRVIFLGDAGDRGPQSWETIKAIAEDPQWEYLIGNHEHMLLGAMCEYLKDERGREIIDFYGNCTELVIYNGGFATIEGWKDDGAESKWINFFLKMPNFSAYNNGQYTISLCHAGFTPETNPISKDILWSRDHFLHPWPMEHKNEIVIHGHTPCQIMPEKTGQRGMKWKPEDGAFWYCGNHKVDIDMGIIKSHQALLLDLDTFDEHIFQLDEDE